MFFYLIFILGLQTYTNTVLYLHMSVHHMMHCVRSAGVGDWAQAHLQQGKGGPLYDYQLQVGQASEHICNASLIFTT